MHKTFFEIPYWFITSKAKLKSHRRIRHNTLIFRYFSPLKQQTFYDWIKNVFIVLQLHFFCFFSRKIYDTIKCEKRIVILSCYDGWIVVFPANKFLRFTWVKVESGGKVNLTSLMPSILHSSKQIKITFKSPTKFHLKTPKFHSLISPKHFLLVQLFFVVFLVWFAETNETVNSLWQRFIRVLLLLVFCHFLTEIGVDLDVLSDVNVIFFSVCLEPR